MNVLFVCTGNVFRSMSAEYLMKKYLKDHNITDISVSSAGTTAHPQPSFPETLARLLRDWCDASHHQQTKLTTDILAWKDLVICMSERHRAVVRELWYDAVLFNEIAYNISSDVMDDTEYEEKNWSNYDLWKYVDCIVDYIHDAIPFIVKNLSKYA